eukprot:616653-Amphidinium_carterae.1
MIQLQHARPKGCQHVQGPEDGRAQSSEIQDTFKRLDRLANSTPCRYQPHLGVKSAVIAAV